MEKSVKISGVVITFNEEKNIARCLKSLQKVCNEIVVVDSFSTDRTKEICLELGVRFITNKFEGHVEQKNFALAQASNDFVLSLDADEELSDELVASIASLDSNWEGKAYRFNRFTNYCGQWIKHSGWYPDRKVRLWDRRVGKWGGTNPHDSVQLNEGISPGFLKGNLLHYSFYTLHEHMTRGIGYTRIAAKALRQQGKKSSFIKRFGSPLYQFFNIYFLRMGFLDGYYGLFICMSSSFFTFLKYSYLRDLNKGRHID
ncbi:glycosyltransferase family 2 protein [uncultured Roseivirga sp.]|uniref:glycosyltransferase family 2 protein n=1 Tax=uncultured Roseivirga sp. TaxID=543088 RepID=UPI002587B36C|nr:glycosyltransferase family 2 protein [uncultured Roseivirga sp.]|tara:strand:- start:2565 stop:3338 length:774 start_codon:yes stop_codon:yes gene_type:complete